MRALFHATQLLLKCTKRFIATLIMVILGIIALTTTAALLAGVALTQEIQTTDYIQKWHENTRFGGDR